MPALVLRRPFTRRIRKNHSYAGYSFANLAGLAIVVFLRLTTDLRERFLKTNQKLTAAVLAALGVHAGGLYAASDDTDTTASSTTLEEVIVTAQRRNESIQDVPITIQAISGAQQ